MESKPYFKVWAAESLLSDDLDELSDHEHRVWFFLMCAASLENPRWSVKISPQLIKKCKSSAQKFTKTIERLEVLGMISVQNGVIAFENASRWNEETEKNRSRKPSDDPAEVRRRVQKHRESKNVTPDVTRYTSDETPTVTPGNASHKEKEEEKEEEEEKEYGVTPPLPPPSERDLAETVLTAVPVKFRHDPGTIDECYQFARDYAGMFVETSAAIAAVRREEGAVYPGRLRKHMPGWKPSIPANEAKPIRPKQAAPRSVDPALVQQMAEADKRRAAIAAQRKTEEQAAVNA